MKEQLEYIDDYFQKQLSESERQEFEQRCLRDEEFAKDVALYIASRQALRDLLLEQKKAAWKPLLTQQDSEDQESIPATKQAAPVRRMPYKKWLGLAVAACAVIAMLIYPIMDRDSAKELVHDYVANDIGLISSTMDASKDSMQLGIIAYNAKEYPESIGIFNSIITAYPENVDALKYLGQAQLLSGEYDNALRSFDLLAAKPGLYSNPGLFLRGVTLMERNAAGDEASAKIIFQRVVNEKLEGEDHAAIWLEKMN